MAEFEKQKRHNMDWYVDLEQGFEDDHELFNAEHEPWTNFRVHDPRMVLLSG